MTMSDALTALGDELEAAARVDLAARTAAIPLAAPASPAPRRRHRRLAVALVAAVIAVPGGALAARHLLAPDEVAASMPAGTLALAGTEPTCTVVTKDIEFHCTLAKAPAIEVTDAQGNPAWKGTVEASVDAAQHVNGGCRSLRDDGLEWQCYIGQEAVDQQIIGQQLLGQTVSGPGVG
jgi:hypothetical protein